MAHNPRRRSVSGFHRICGLPKADMHLLSWSAVMRGAVLRGLEESVVRQRKSRNHYGIQLKYLYNEDKHRDIAKDGYHVHLKKDKITGELYLNGFMEWKFPKVRNLLATLVLILYAHIFTRAKTCTGIRSLTFRSPKILISTGARFLAPFHSTLAEMMSLQGCLMSLV